MLLVIHTAIGDNLRDWSLCCGRKLTTGDCQNARGDASFKIGGCQGYKAHDLHDSW